MNNGIELIKLNVKLIIFSIIGLFIFIITLNLLPFFYIPFFSPILFIPLLCAVIFIYGWISHARKKDKAYSLKDIFIGVIPLFALSFFSGLWVLYTNFFGDFEANNMLDVSVMFYTFILICAFLAGVSFVVFFKFIIRLLA